LTGPPLSHTSLGAGVYHLRNPPNCQLPFAQIWRTISAGGVAMMSLKREIVGEIVVIVVIDTMLVGFFGAPRWGSHLIPLQQLWPAAGNVLTAGPLFALFHLGLAGHWWF
jgi:hypothetical protein